MLVSGKPQMFIDYTPTPEEIEMVKEAIAGLEKMGWRPRFRSSVSVYVPKNENLYIFEEDYHKISSLDLNTIDVDFLGKLVHVQTRQLKEFYRFRRGSLSVISDIRGDEFLIQTEEDVPKGTKPLNAG